MNAGRIVPYLLCFGAIVVSSSAFGDETTSATGKEKTVEHVGTTKDGREIAVGHPGKDSPVSSTREGKTERVDFATGFKAEAGPKGELKNAKESETTITRETTPKN